MRELNQEEIQNVGGAVSSTGGAQTEGCTGFLWYLATGTICCAGGGCLKF